jgi:alpha-L-rhamnosidase
MPPAPRRGHAAAVAAAAAFASLATSASAAAAPSCAFLPTRLTVEYLPSSVNASLGPAAAASFFPRITDSPAPLLGWWDTLLVNPAPSPPLPLPLSLQSAYRIVVASSPSLLPSSPDIFDTGVVPSSASVAVPYGGPLLASHTRVYWTVSVWDGANTSCGFSPEIGVWEVPLLTDADWGAAGWITRDAPHPPPADCDLYADDPAPLFRGPFALAQPGSNVVRARLHVAGLGYFIPYMDGAQVGDEVLAPGWTDFNKTVLYSTFDVTPTLAASADLNHVLGVAVGNGFFNLVPLRFWGSREFRAALPTGDPMARALLVVRFADGTVQEVGTEAGPGSQAPWSVGDSEILFNSIYLGTRVDRRSEPVGWATVGFANASGWPAAQPVAPSTLAGLGLLRAQSVPPVRRQSPALAATVLASPAPGEIVLDFGEQVAGVCTVCFSAGVPAGSGLTTRHGELLYANGSVNGMTAVAGQVKNGNGGPCSPEIAFEENHYTFRGDAGGECFTPTFTWQSGRYVALFASPAVLAALDASSTVCHHLRSDVDVVGSFESSSPLLNAIHRASVNTAANNLMSVQSDCPARERLGYSGDALMAGESLLTNFDFSVLLRKRVRDMVEAQRANGGYTETSPFVGISDAGMGDQSGPIGWATFTPVAVGWQVKYFGTPTGPDVYDSLTGYVEFLDTLPAGPIENGLGDWMSIENKALALTGRGFQLQSYREYANISALVGNATQAALYAAKAANLTLEINARFLDPTTGVYSAATGAAFNNTQCGQSMPLFLGLVPPSTAPLTLAALASNLAAHGGHLQVGGFGVKYLLMALSDGGRADLALGIMDTTAYPSFGYMLNGTANGLTNATTIWESWFTSDNTYSHDHGMFTSNEVWAYQGLGGIQPHPSAVGFDRVLIKPAPPPAGLAWVNATLRTVRGTVSSGWTVDPGTGLLSGWACLPPNVVGEVWVPRQGGGAGAAGGPWGKTITGVGAGCTAWEGV